jgi:type VI secretion system FHA domain protein
MILTLEITGPHEKAPSADSRKVFHATGGTIGRLPDNDWVLPDPYVSSHHAKIRYVNGTFQIEDTSTNGVFINTPENRLVRGQPYTLKPGDRVLIEPYEIDVSIESKAADDPFGLSPALPPSSSSSSTNPFGIDPIGPSGRMMGEPLDPFAPAHAVESQEVDPLKILGAGAAPLVSSKAPRSDELPPPPVWRDHYPPPAPILPEPEEEDASNARVIPTGYNPLGDVVAEPSRRRAPSPAVPPKPSQQKAAPQVPAPAPSESPRGVGDFDLSRVLMGAGLDPKAVTPELANDFGLILRVVVSGLMDVLQARQRTKTEFGMGNTVFQPKDNNPLKFSANVEDALHNLLVKRNAAYLNPVEAFEDAFQDIRNHQIAMLAGVRVAFDTMLARFDPEQLQQQFDRKKKGALVSVPAKMRYWDLYRDWIHDMVHDADDSFRELFGDAFAQAYEDQLRRLKAHGPRKSQR